VFNDRAGNDHENVAAKVALLGDDRRHELIALQRERWSKPVRPIVFDGSRQPDPLDNPLLARLLDVADWPAPETLEPIARRDSSEGGLGYSDWLAAERPVALFAGQAFSVRGQAAVVLRRRQYEHLCVVGEQHAERAAILSAALTSACLQLGPSAVRIVISDRSIPGTEWSAALASFSEHATHTGYDVRYSCDEAGTADSIEGAAVEIERRQALPELERLGEPAYFVALAEPNRTPSLVRVADDYGYEDAPLTRRLQHVLDHGPAVGVHVLAGFTSVGTAASIISDKRLQVAFRHKIAMQMSEDDSFVMVRSPKASKLQPDGPRPVAALLFDAQSDRALKFKPYTMTVQGSDHDDPASHGTFAEQIEAIFERLRGRLR
jgi:S-DNA-T family DNA segregation ATPase FtsK/SpoIIIE